MNPDDRKEDGRKGEISDITSHFLRAGREELRMTPPCLPVPYEIPRRSVVTCFPEANVPMPIVVLP
jgi:hypothetical protein